MKLGIIRPAYLIVILLGAVLGSIGTFALMSRATNPTDSTVSPAASNSCSTQCQITKLQNQINSLNSTVNSLNSNLNALNLSMQQLNSSVYQLNSKVNQLNATVTALLVHPTAPYAFVYGYVTTPCGGIACGPHTPITGNITFVPYNATFPRIIVSVTGGSGFYQANLTLTVQYLAHVDVVWDTGNPGGCYEPVTITTPGITRLDISC